VAPLLAVQFTLIAVEETAVAETPVGVPGGATIVVAVTVAEGDELPPEFVATTR
jgi:hypothetical protein